MRAPEVEEELREQAELSGELEAIGVVLLIVSKAVHQLDEEPVEPPDHIHLLLGGRVVDSLTRCEHSGCLLVESIGHLSDVVISRHDALDSSDSESLLAIHMLILGLELHVHFGLLLQLNCLVDVEVDSHGLVLIDSSQVPAVSATRANLSARDILGTVRLVFDRCALTDAAGYFEFFRCEYLELAEESHL